MGDGGLVICVCLCPFSYFANADGVVEALMTYCWSYQQIHYAMLHY